MWNAQTVFVVLSVMIFLVLNLLILSMLVPIIAPWIRANTSGVPLHISEIIGMRLRRIDVKAVLRALVTATQAGAPVSCREMEWSYLQGVDLEKITLAFVHAKKKGMETTFQELVEAEMEDRLRQKLG